MKTEIETGGVAVVGLAGRFPGATNVEEFWRNLRGGVESVSFFTEEELLRAGVESARLRAPNYVKAKGVLEGCETFDAAFFGFSPREAEMMDPQHRVFLECAWHALEHAGYDPERYRGAIGLFAGASTNGYLLFNLLPHRRLMEALGNLQLSLQNRTDHLTTHVAYELNLRGPAVTVQTACSTSLVAVHLACQSLLNGESDMALAGGVTVSVPPLNGYLHQAGGILSSDGHCRAFDAKADGTVDGNGVGVVVLKRLEDALEDGDTIHAVIRGSAINNDGSHKVGFTAPGVRGQIEVIAEAQAVAGIAADTITYIEAHGTGTTLGDPIEIEALTEAFRASTDRRQFCAIGSVKASIGHLDVAAGVAGLIKTVLALKSRELPPSLNFERPNPVINFGETPFFVNTELREWSAADGVRRAGVSSFGIGGTNAHAVLEEAPAPTAEATQREAHLLVLSAKSAAALDAATINLISHLREHPDAELADVAYTLQNGRRAFDYRRVAVCRGAADAMRSLETLDHRRVYTGLQEPRVRPVVLMFPGQGSQYAGMGAGLYAQEPVFRREVDRCAELLRRPLGFDLREVLFAGEGTKAEASERLRQTAVTQPALFVIEYALAQQWLEWGVTPTAMIGHSVGEYVAACLAGVFELEDALALVAARGRLMQGLPPGAMLVVPLPEPEVRALLPDYEGLSLAAVNAPSLCVVSGPPPAIDALERELDGRHVSGRRLQTSHAFHSAMMEPILAEFTREVRQVRLSAPSIPYVSNVTGTWVTPEEATSPDYWARHLRSCVRFNDGIVELLGERERVFLEVGPGRTLSTLLRQHPQKGTTRVVLSSLRHADESGADAEMVLATLGRLWLAGVEVRWEQLYEGERRRRVPLPAYPFERRRYWVDPPRLQGAKGQRGGDGEAAEGKRADIAEWFYAPSWKRLAAPVPRPAGAEAGARWLIFLDDLGLGRRLAQSLADAGREVVTIKLATTYGQLGERAYALDPTNRAGYSALFKDLHASGFAPARVVHLWGVTGGEQLRAEEVQGRVFHSLVHLAQALGETGETHPLRLCIVTDGMQEVTGEETLCPDKALAIGPCRIIPQEYEHITCRSVDVAVAGGPEGFERLAGQLMAEADSGDAETILAYRGPHRWAQTFEPLRLGEGGPATPRLRERGVYLLTGGLGGMALELADYLAGEARARLVLVGRTPLPPLAEWDELLATRPLPDSERRRIERIRALEARGAEVLVVAADVADAAQFEAAVEQARRRFGRINGVIHTAGVAGGGLIQLMKPEAAERVLAPKVRGARLIESLLAAEPLDFLALCSSRSSILGGYGQVDYCAANAFLDAFAHDFTRRTGTPAVSIDWDAWAEVGMLVKTVEQFGLRGAGVRADARGTGHPLLDTHFLETAEQSVYATQVSPATHWVLDDHRIVGTAIMPGTAYLEMGRAAFERREGEPGEGMAYEIRDAFFLAPLGLRDNEVREVRTIVERDGPNYQFRVLGQIAAEDGGEPAWQSYAIGQIGLAPAEPSRRHDLATLRERCNLREIVITDEHEIDPDLGPRWQSLRRVHLGSGELLAALELPEEFAPDFTQFKLHPALLDRATGTAKHYLVKEGHYLPMSYKRLHVRGTLPRKIYAHIKFRDDLPQEETITFDIVLLDQLGAECVIIDGFSQKRVNNTAEPLRTLGATAPRDTGAVAAQSSGVYEKGLREGILPHEGAAAFARIISNPVPPQVVVSARDLQASIEEMRDLTAADVIEEAGRLEVAPPATMHPRPATLSDYAAPRTPAERKLAAILQTMLGIEQVGIHDNFFELGGDSVLGIQLIAQAKRAGVNLTPQQLFQHPTIAEMAVISDDGSTAAPLLADAAEEEAGPELDLSLTALSESQMNRLIEMIAEETPEAAVQPAPAGPPAADVTPAPRQPLTASGKAAVTSGTNGGAPDGDGRFKTPDFSLFFFAADNLRPGEDKYGLYLEGARFADRQGFSAVWTPERHFHESGGPYPNPSVLSAALAAVTTRVGLRAGSVVMPLHHPVRVAEEWAIVDNLSRGRVGLSFTSGWIPNDFAFFPERFARKREEMFHGIEEVRRLWRGQPVAARDGAGKAVELHSLPRPVQPELPVWLTCSGDPEMFVKAGELGFNVLTALLTQSVEEVAQKLALYREARARHGHDPAGGHVTLMLHTFVGADAAGVVAAAREPLCEYLKAHVGLIETMTKSLDIAVGLDKEQYLDDLVAFAFERYYQTASLIGTPEKCLAMVERLGRMGVDEVACFIDFGVETGAVLEGLNHLARLRELSLRAGAGAGSHVNPEPQPLAGASGARGRSATS